MPTSDQELELCLRVLREAASWPGDDPRTLALEQAAAGLRKLARDKRRQERKDAQRAQDLDVMGRAAMHASAPYEDAQPDDSVGELHHARLCYVCKTSYKKIHKFYRDLCLDCARENWSHREARADLRGRRGLVTGGRTKIGYACALKLLRDGAEVLVTTRFPKSAAERFAKEPDFAAWRARLSLVGLDLRDVGAVLRLCAGLRAGPALDFLIHNAAQTVQRPPAYHRAQARRELEAPPTPLLWEPARSSEALRLASAGTLAPIHADLGAFHRACSDAPDDPHFPPHALDVEGEPLDLRPRNTWRLKLDEVEPWECAEVWLVNVLAPFVINGQLRERLAASRFEDRYIVNVSAVEGQFSYLNKTAHHPHTNMAKAALNMMTRTSAQDYADDGIYMTSVDTGWITDENSEAVRAKLREQHFLPPLDVVDAAARLYHPIVRGVAHGERLCGVFLKDYKPCPW